MKLVSLGSKPEIKVAELTLGNRVRLLFSYGEPVAAFIPGRGYVRTETFVSVTTERHIATWTESPFQVDKVPSDFFNQLLGAKDAEASSRNLFSQAQNT